MTEYKADAELAADMAKIRSYRVFFGHQSVGENIVDGITDLQRLAGVENLNVIHYKHGTGMALPDSFLAHEWVGSNREPQSKFDDFRRIIDTELEGKVDIALVKLCYVDIDRDSDVDAVFDGYRKAIQDLRARHPRLVVVPVTSALMVKEGYSKYKTFIKGLLGKENDNVKRNAFNAKVREAFRGQPIFDLAEAEATFPDGTRETYGKGGSQQGLAGIYTSDGGHLNGYGRKFVARELIRTLARIELPRPAPADSAVSQAN